VAAMQAQAAARGEGLQLFLHDQVLPDLESEHQGFSARLTRLGERLAEAVEKAQRALLGAGEARLESFRQESGSDFRGGPGDPEAAAAARAAEAVSRAEEQLQKLQLTQSGLANAGRTFSHSLTQVERHFEEIHELPRKLDAILKRVGI
jgi:hypothetical protein